MPDGLAAATEALSTGRLGVPGPESQDRSSAHACEDTQTCRWSPPLPVTWLQNASLWQQN